VVAQSAISASDTALTHHCVPGPTTHARSYHQPRPATAASGGSNGEQAPGRLAAPKPDPAPAASGGNNGERAPGALAHPAWTRRHARPAAATVTRRPTIGISPDGNGPFEEAAAPDSYPQIVHE
jgi:hypothetical protein